jgi:hypothetical protein
MRATALRVHGANCYVDIVHAFARTRVLRRNHVVARISLSTRSMKTLGVAICFAAFTACVDQPIETTESASVPIEIENITPQPHAAICNGGRFRCYAHRRLDESGRIKAFATASGIGATDLASAYALDTSVDPSATIAIVDAYGYSNLASDLAQYRSHYGLPACTVANGCLKIVNQQGQTSPLPPNPPSNDDWTGETSLDVDMASAACPKCKILVVQADDDQGDGLYIANTTAASLGATVVSNSWGGPEDNTVASSETYFNHPGIAVFVASGDNGYTGSSPDYPSTSAYTIGVGGTSLTQSTANPRGWIESAWSSGGSSCSQNVAKPAWQTNSACAMRMTADVSAVGDPNTGLAVYDGGWQIVGGTSAASPLVAGIFALTKNGGATAQFAYTNAAAFYDVTSGKNGTCTTALCKAAAGWDGPTGNGTPNGAMLAALGGTGGGSGSGSGSGSGGGSGSDTGMGSDSGSGGNTGSGSDTGSGGNGDNGNGGNHGGCNAGGGSGGGLIILGFAFIARRRRYTK